MTAWRSLGVVSAAPPAGATAAAFAVPSADGFVDPPGLLVRADVLAAVGEPEQVRAGGLADLVARLEDAGHAVVALPATAPRRRVTPAALLREGSGRFWLFRRHPERHPLPRPAKVGRLRYPWLVLGALHANAPPARRTER